MKATASSLLEKSNSMENRGKILDAVLELAAKAPFDAIENQNDNLISYLHIFAVFETRNKERGGTTSKKNKRKKKTVCTKRKKKRYSLTRKRFSLRYES